MSFNDLDNDPIFKSIAKNYELQLNLGINESLNGENSKSREKFSIIKEEVNKIEYKNYTSYTFRIKRRTDDPNVLENLVLENKNGKEVAFILKYKFQGNSLNYLVNKENNPIHAKVWIEFLGSSDQNKNEVCRWQTISRPYFCHCAGHGPWDSCTCTPSAAWMIESVQICQDNPDGTDLFSQVDDGGFGGGGSGGPSPSDGDTGMLPEDTSDLVALGISTKIDTENLDPCTKGIVNQLKGLQTNNIKEIILRFDAPESAYKWNLMTGIPPINSSNAAETDWFRDNNGLAIPNNYSTYINPNIVDKATKIALARIILHEMLHAYIISMVDDALIGGSPDVKNFKILWNALVNQTYDNNPNRLQHEIIARKYIEPLRDALKEWDNNPNTDDQYYEDLAWGALFGTSSFNKIYPEGTTARNRIINTNNAEDKNTNQNGVLPKGDSC